MIDRSVQPVVNKLGELQFLLPERGTMPNGVPFSIIRTGQVEMVRIDLVFQGGNYHQSSPLQSMATNRMMREGTSCLTSAEVEEKLDYYGAWLNLYATDQYSLVTVFALNRFVSQVWDLLEQIVKGPAFPEREFRVLMENKYQQYHVTAANSDYVANQYFNLSLFGAEHPNGRKPSGADYLALPIESLKAFYDLYYNSANCSVYLSGLVTDEVVKATERVFGSAHWGRSCRKAQPLQLPVNPASEHTLFVSRTAAAQNSIRLGELTVGVQHEDYLSLKVLVSLFGGYFGSRLMRNIREEKGYTYDISASLTTVSGKGVFCIASEADAAYTEAVVREVYREMRVLQQEPVGSEELATLRNYLFGQLCRRLEGGLSLSNIWIMLDQNGLGDDYYKRMWQTQKEITPERLLQLAQQYFHPGVLTEVVVGKKNTNKR